MSEVRIALSLCLPILTIAASSWADPVAEPYRVYTAGPRTKVFSGPGSDHYATQELSAGTECEVYEELGDGWLAIRPPQGSYSLVLRAALGDTEGDVAQVARDNTPARVGSVLSDKYSSVHVRLEKGELVQVIDDGMAANSPWVTIAPPAGEFRWIRESDVVLSPTKFATATVNAELLDASHNEAPPGQWHEQQEGIGIPAEDSDVILAASHTQTDDESEQAPTNPADVTPAQQPTRDTSFASKLNQLEIQLSRRVAGPVNLWVFDDLEQTAAQLLSVANTPAEEQAVRNMASRMGRFAALGKRYRATETPAAPTTSADPTMASIAASNGDNAGDPALAQFDAVGVLRPVVSTRGNAPPYALVDDAGNVVTFITPSPTLNLQQHLGQRVGVSGTRGFLPEYRSRNIQTARVAPLAAPTLR